jgi:hypothetical protein
MILNNFSYSGLGVKFFRGTPLWVVPSYHYLLGPSAKSTRSLSVGLFLVIVDAGPRLNNLPLS